MGGKESRSQGLIRFSVVCIACRRSLGAWACRVERDLYATVVAEKGAIFVAPIIARRSIYGFVPLELVHARVIHANHDTCVSPHGKQSFHARIFDYIIPVPLFSSFLRRIVWTVVLLFIVLRIVKFADILNNMISLDFFLTLFNMPEIQIDVFK